MDPFDCELFRSGLLTQPVNSISALAFVAAGIFLWRRGRPDIGVIAGATGIGSIWFHSDPSGAASWAHDISLYALIAVAAIELWRRIAARQPPVLATGVFLAGIFFWSIGRSGSPFCDTASLLQWHAAWHVLAAGAVVILFSEKRIAPTG